MPVQTNCPSCRVSLRLLDARPGEALNCPKCKRQWVPGPSDLRAVPALPASFTPSVKPPAPSPNLPPASRASHGLQVEPAPFSPKLAPQPAGVKNRDRRVKLYAAGGIAVAFCMGIVVWLAAARKPASREPSAPNEQVAPIVATVVKAEQPPVVIEPEKDKKEDKPPAEPKKESPVRKEAPAPEPKKEVKPAEPLSGEQVYARLIRSSCLILTKTGNLGSGFVVHVDRRLVVTNYHVVGKEDGVAVLFPLYDSRGELVTDLRKYKSRVKEVAIHGEVIVRDTRHDLALIEVDRLPTSSGEASLAERPAPTGSVVYSVGASGVDENLLWRFTRGNVRGRIEKQLEVDYGKLDCMILETDAPVNPGDSGGPVMNDRGNLVGVVSHFRTSERNVSGNVDVDEVRKFLSSHLK